MKTLHVSLPDKTYDVCIGSGLLDTLGRASAALSGGESVCVISDETVWQLHGHRLSAAMEQACQPFHLVVLPPGEATKSMEGLARIYAALSKANMTRKGLVIAFGGGVIGDVSGFAAATYMRGVHCIQVPTTLLAQVDSSVGGKTAINLPSGKNLAGAFFQPDLVIADTDLLKTLPERQWACGLAEIIKYGMIVDTPLLDWLEEDWMQNEAICEAVVHECCRIKAEIVQHDERESGQRKLLNFGHTFGHAIESIGGYSDYTHGEAVSIGMMMAARLGALLGVTPQESVTYLQAVLRKHKLPEDCPYSSEALFSFVRHDKKSSAEGIDLVLLQSIGHAVVCTTAVSDIEHALKEVLDYARS